MKKGRQCQVSTYDIVTGGDLTPLPSPGEALLCVRYRYDAKAHRQYKTVEIIVSESEWMPPPAKYPDGALVPLKIGIKETAL